ncbi:hypothetical protein TOL_3167 [Thalassolituus oleivorans MIL-1]|uniref:Uncharacterized protein n=1 Tax=Thalassolituus oleivorans MIL-1 TaxID=1298593 RepID=M5DWD0_9GAMM|nr:hypothetical protein TOL_3167 [Thalassolituus oleivorans MIL-1]
MLVNPIGMTAPWQESDNMIAVCLQTNDKVLRNPDPIAPSQPTHAQAC